MAIIFVPSDMFQGYYYLDPGSGSLFIQLAIGAFVGGLFLIKNYFVRIKCFFKKLFNNGKKV
ncbi:MAG: hypothetical protein C4555_06505 [Dehalococcoidia bacterium]|jgi:hypothetical protein|nr:MAG: hypothetical protein C4555_06505 [Dehalococcoidia bacterium]